MSEWERKFHPGQVVRVDGDNRPATVLWYLDTANADGLVLVSLPHGNGSLRKAVSESELSA